MIRIKEDAMDRDIRTMLRQVAATTLRMDDRFADAWRPTQQHRIPAKTSIVSRIALFLRPIPASSSRPL
jgi:hypothetical protein